MEHKIVEQNYTEKLISLSYCYFKKSKTLYFNLNKPFCRLVVAGSKMTENSLNAKVFRFDAEYGLTQTEVGFKIVVV